MFRYAAVLLLLSWPASAEVHLDYTFSEWEKLQDDDRAAYVAGLIDTLRDYGGNGTSPEDGTALQSN